MPRKRALVRPLPTIWRVPDELWRVVERVLGELDPPKRIGRKRIDPRGVLDAIIFRLRSGCQWNHLPREFPDDSSVHRTFQRWVRQVQVPESARIEQEGRGVIADLQPGLSVGITGRPDGTARSIRIFPAALGTPRPGQFPMAGAEQGNLMTNSVIESFDGQTLVVSAAGSRFEVTVPPETEVLKPVPGTFADLAAGKRVLASGTVGADGTLVASVVNLLGPPPTLAQ